MRWHRFGVDELGDESDQQVIIYSAVSACTAAELSKPAENRIFVQPHWVDGRYRVQVLEPG